MFSDTNHSLSWKSLGIFLGLFVIICSGIVIFAFTNTVIMPEVRRFLIPYENSMPLTNPQDLLLGQEDIPTNWDLGVVKDFPELSFQYTSDVVGRWYSHPNNLEFKESGMPDPAFHIVARYAFVESAQKEATGLAGIFTEGEDLGWQFESNADAFIYNCVIQGGVRDGIAVCEFVARYGEYVSFLSIRPEITESDSDEIARILTRLDKKFESIVTSR